MKTQSSLKSISWLISMLALASLLLSACASPNALAQTGENASSSAGQTIALTLKTNLSDGKLSFVGVGGSIDGQTNPDLKVTQGDTVQVTLINGDGMEHDFTVEGLNAHTDRITGKGKQALVTFKVEQPGEIFYYCSVPGHRQMGMQGRIVVAAASGTASSGGSQPQDLSNTGGNASQGGMNSQNSTAGTGTLPPADPNAVDISRDPTDLPGPIGNRPPTTIRVDLNTQEVDGKLADGTTYHYWTYNGKIPGPFIRVRVGDTLDVHLQNAATSQMTHSIDLHAATGPGGGAAYTQAAPGEEKNFQFKALNPGIFVYHCATPMVSQHITSGMFGMILVEPEGGLPKVDREFYVMQNEMYTTAPFGSKGMQAINVDRLLSETPDYFVFNGAVGALTTGHPLKAKTGETIRIFFGDAGPNAISSFHIIGEIMDRVYEEGSLTSGPLTNVQTTVVPPGGATMVELTLQVPGRFNLVDHALSRMERGLLGYLVVEGPDVPDIFHSDQAPSTSSGH